MTKKHDTLCPLATNKKGLSLEQMIAALDHHFRRERWVQALSNGFEAHLFKTGYEGVKVWMKDGHNLETLPDETETDSRRESSPVEKDRGQAKSQPTMHGLQYSLFMGEV